MMARATGDSKNVSQLIAAAAARNAIELSPSAIMTADFRTNK